jgi:hypothetical protein
MPHYCSSCPPEKRFDCPGEEVCLLRAEVKCLSTMGVDVLDILEWSKRAERAEAEVERLKDAWESAELRADDGWREAERQNRLRRKAVQKARRKHNEIKRLRKLCADRPNMVAATMNLTGAVIAFDRWLDKIDAAGRGEESK